MNKLRQYRRELHAIPELGLEEWKTQSYLLEKLKPYRCKIFNLSTGIIAFFDNYQEETIGFRADMDGLALEEENKVSYRSQHPECMHACGHDGHMAILLGLAEVVHQTYYSVNVCLVFQPSEEEGQGAKKIIESHILQDLKVIALYGLHLWPGLEYGSIYAKPEAQMAQSLELNVVLKGVSKHAKERDIKTDALYWACRFLIESQQQSKKEVSNALVHCGIFQSGTARNCNSDYTLLKYTIRSFVEQELEEVLAVFQKIKETIEKNTQVTIQFQLGSRYPLVSNSIKLYDIFFQKGIIKKLESPVYAAEDFGCYQTITETLFVFLGLGEVPPLHSKTFDFQEEVLEEGFTYFKQILEEYQSI